ncbi:MAG: PilZ domain-containing protein [Vicinamibacteraceae bacterium]|nr:PilZ domain-containing protein [Vicinamibacteraceae bacterium]
MTEPRTERRRYLRVPVGARDLRLQLPSTATVQLLDISESGVLLSSTARLAVGQRARLRTRLGTDPVSAVVEVTRLAGHQPGGPRRYGARFVELDDEQRARITRFLGAV